MWVYFNSQPHKEADNFISNVSHVRIYFNSQPHKEADYSRAPMGDFRKHFNSQPHKEADGPASDFAPEAFKISTHSLTRRLTPKQKYVEQGLFDFNSQPHKEADLARMCIANMIASFQLTASQGG